MEQYEYLLNRSDIFKLDLDLDEATIDIISRVSVAQAKKLEKRFFPHPFPESGHYYFQVGKEDVRCLRNELYPH